MHAICNDIFDDIFLSRSHYCQKFCNPIQQNDIVGYDCTTKVPPASIISGAVGECDKGRIEKPGQMEFNGYIIQASEYDMADVYLCYVSVSFNVYTCDGDLYDETISVTACPTVGLPIMISAKSCTNYKKSRCIDVLYVGRVCNIDTESNVEWKLH